MLKKLPFVALMLFAVGLLAAAPAQASDASLKKVIKQQEKKLKPLLEEFEKAGESLESEGTFKDVKREVTDVRKGIAAYKKAVTNTSGSSADGKKARTKLLAAIKEMDRGFEDFETFIAEAEDGDKSGLKAAEKKFEARFEKAEKLEDQAMKLLGVESED